MTPDRAQESSADLPVNAEHEKRYLLSEGKESDIWGRKGFDGDFEVL